MKKAVHVFAGLTLILSVALPLHAQNGCVNSPENPTVVLALVGSAGALFSAARARLRARRNSSQR
jgi:XrtJ-associated TM-motif-TM protein